MRIDVLRQIVSDYDLIERANLDLGNKMIKIRMSFADLPTGEEAIGWWTQLRVVLGDDMWLSQHARDYLANVPGYDPNA